MMVPQQQRRRRRRVALPRTSERRLVVARGAIGFGFTIAGQRPCVVSAVTSGGPAERAGLRAGDALLAVDGASVARAPHVSVARLVAAAPGAISLSVAPRESPPTDTEDTEPDERARTRRRHPPPRRRPQMLHHPACHAAPSTSGVNEILQNLTRAQLTPIHMARLECRAVVGYLGTIETPQATPNAAPGNVRTAVRKLRQERRPATPVLLSVLPNSLLLRRPSGQILAQYQRERIVYAGCGSEADRRYFGLVTAAESPESEASHSCHVFAVDPRMAEHEAHIVRGREFQIVCTRDPVAERCLEFPPSAEYVVGVIRGMYSLPADDCTSPNLQQISKLAVKSDSPVVGNFSRCNRPLFRMPRDRRPCRHEDARVEGQEFVANSPQPSNHSEVTTTSSNSDSGIGFHNDCRNIADRILVVDFAQQGPPNRFRQDMPRRPMGLVGCSSFDADGSFLSNTTPVVDGFGGQGRPLNLDDVILNSNDLQTVRHVSPRKEDDNYNYNNVYGNVPSSSKAANGVVYDQVYTENEGHHYEYIPQQLDMDLEIDRVAETFNSVEIYEERPRQPPDWQSNESVENVTVISGGTSKASMDSVSMYSSRSHEEARPALRRHLQASLDDMLVLGLRNQAPDKDKDNENFVHPATIKYKVRKSMKPLNILSKTKSILSGKERSREKKPSSRRRALSASAGDVCGADDPPPELDPLPAAASEPDLRGSQDNYIVREKRHECQPDFIKNEIDEKLFKCKTDVSSPEFPTVSSVYNAAVASYKNSGLDLIQKIPPLKSIKSTLYRSRNTSVEMKKIVYKNVAKVKIPKTYIDFLLADYSYEGKRILVFSSQRSRKVISQGKHFMADGTFKSCPIPFLQLYTIHCDIGSTAQSTNIIPVAYALLSNKDTETYENLFRIIKSQIPEWNPTTFKTDFEMAAINAIISVFPTVSRKGCYFHYSRAIWKKGKDLGLTKSKITRRQVALCAVLPHLPEDQIFNGWSYITAQSPDDKDSKLFREYMLNQWIRDEFIPIWCIFGERHRTTNILESWHNKLNKVIKRKQPNIVELLKALHNDASYYEVISQQVENPSESTQPNNRSQKSLLWENFILKKSSEFLDGKITVGHFLEMLR